MLVSFVLHLEVLLASSAVLISIHYGPSNLLLAVLAVFIRMFSLFAVTTYATAAANPISIVPFGVSIFNRLFHNVEPNTDPCAIPLSIGTDLVVFSTSKMICHFDKLDAVILTRYLSILVQEE